jgi:uncharacterized lipoprotein YehR (DUF1307 family)
MRIAGRIVLLMLVVAGAAIGWASINNQAGETGKPKVGLVLKDQKDIYSNLEGLAPNVYIDDYGALRVYGSAKNLSQKTCSYAKFNIELRNSADKLVKTLNVTVKDIEPGVTKSYDVNGGTGVEGLKTVGKITEAGFVER